MAGQALGLGHPTGNESVRRLPQLIIVHQHHCFTDKIGAEIGDHQVMANDLFLFIVNVV